MMLKTITLGDQIIDLSTPVVMGILNVTPDSFYDGGKYMSELQIMRRVDEVVEQGAGIIDVGAYSTRPGAAFVEEREELSRLSFAVELIRKYHPHLPVSIDTFRANVAKEIFQCLGPVIVNDISGGNDGRTDVPDRGRDAATLYLDAYPGNAPDHATKSPLRKRGRRGPCLLAGTNPLFECLGIS